jgi:hypothetical protein
MSNSAIVLKKERPSMLSRQPGRIKRYALFNARGMIYNMDAEIYQYMGNCCRVIVLPFSNVARKINCKRRTPANLAFHFNSAAMRFNELFGYGQA